MSGSNEHKLNLITYFYIFSLCFTFSSCSSSPPGLLLGVHPLDEKYYEREVIKCKDGSKSFSRDRLNDNFCDCPDGTDEPGTSACPAGKFYCKNTGSTPRFLFSSSVNDHICDCCDGSDEYDGLVVCPNTCVMGGNIAYQTTHHESVASHWSSVKSKKTEVGTYPAESIKKLLGLKVLVFLQVAFVIVIVGFRLFRRRRTRRRHIR